MGSSGEELAITSHDPPQRKLVTIRRISQLTSIKRSRWEVATVGGWNVVVIKGQYSIGELVVYFEIDSFLPTSNERFWEYTRLHASQYYRGEQGYAVKTIMRLDHISQGLIFPLDEFPEININKRGELKNMIKDSPEKVEKAMMELDYAELLGVRKFEQRFEDDDAPIYGRSPIFFPQPGCDRAQNVVNLFEIYADKQFIVTEKLDGIPITIYNVEARSQWYKALPCDRDAQPCHRPCYGICDRWVDYLEEEDSIFWQTIRVQGVIERMQQIVTQRCIPDQCQKLNNFAVQGEFCGDSVLSNSMGFEPDQHRFYAFGIYDITAQKWLPPEISVEICKTIGISHVPVIGRVKLKDFAKSVEELLAKAEGRGVLGRNREGLVFRTLDHSFGFKAIANSWLLEYGHHKTTPDQW